MTTRKSAACWWITWNASCGRARVANTRSNRGKKQHTRAQGIFVAPFDGTHGWYWRNRGGKPVMVKVNVMHSEASNCREREQSGAIDHHVDVSAMSQPFDDDEGLAVVILKNEVTPERILEARRNLSAIEALVADDVDLQDVVVAWSLELRGKEASEYLGWEMNRYEAARKRLVRRLETMKEGYK